MCGCQGFNIEAFVVRVALGEIGLEGFYQQNARANVTFQAGRKPNFVIYKSLFENETRSLLKIGQESGAKRTSPTK
jgi:hypothetical protein